MPPPPPPLPQPTSINLSSDPGDYIGGGQAYSYSQADAQITVAAQGALLTISIDGDESWQGDFRLPDSCSQLEPGTYNNLTRYPFHDPAIGGLSWSGEGRGRNTLTAIDLRFEQHCEGGGPALHGELHWIQ